MANIPVELAESDWPIMIERYGLVTDSGGAGRYRGGLAVERVWRALVPETAVHVRSDRQVHRPYGLAGGLEGGASSSLLRRADGTLEQMPPMFVADLHRGDVLHHRMPGGGGWGEPFAREPEAVAEDVLDEKISVAAARELYGVSLGQDGSIDAAETEALRRQKAAT
jgi:N-methylhydantoinase B